ncbi:MAG: ABC transporter permease, partial [Verrucomicrobiae bacterium]|nr:ABC transporter permease [Verrucomicrobiae bacterium]
MRILDFALQELWRQKGRNAAVFVVHASLVFVLASVLLMASALRHEAGLVLAASPELIVQRLCAGRHSMIPLSYREPIETIRGVRAVKPRYWGYYYDPPPGTTYTLMASDEESPFAKAFSDAVQEQDDNPWTCVVGAGIAEARMLEPGDLLPVKAADGGVRALRVIGVFTAESQLMTHDLILLRASAWRSVFDIQEAVATDLAVEVANPEEADTVSRKILERLPDVRVISRQAML